MTGPPDTRPCIIRVNLPTGLTMELRGHLAIDPDENGDRSFITEEGWAFTQRMRGLW